MHAAAGFFSPGLIRRSTNDRPQNQNYYILWNAPLSVSRDDLGGLAPK